MKHFIISTEPNKDGNIQFVDKDYHYLVRVRRLAVGECFPALLPNGEETIIKVISVNNKVLTGRCEGDESSCFGVQRRDKHQDVCPWGGIYEIAPIVLFQAMPKGDKMDLIVRQAAESDIAEIVPFISEFSVARAPSVESQKLKRWERIIKEARQQSGSRNSAALHHPLRMDELLNYWKKLKNEGALGLVFHHQVYQKGLEQKSLHGYLNMNPKMVVFVVGPEGGFSDAEISLFLESGFELITIGNTVLRTETAALYCAAAIRIILLERETWELKKSKSKKKKTSSG
jgi:16S rRNA (uracil1498-N3)-methyltransferase